VGSMPHIMHLNDQVKKAGKDASIIFLGDNIYPKGMPPEEHKDRSDAERSILGQLKAVEDTEGKVVFLGGNHDWQKGKRDGWEYIREQEKFIESTLGDEDVFLPGDGCPGPMEVALDKELVLIVYDSQWMLHPWDKPLMEEDCDAKSNIMVLEFIEDAVRRHPEKKIIVAAHHPIITYGIHGGSTTFKDHLFPLTEINESLYIPIPILGSIYPIYRKYIGNIQDTQHPQYKSINETLMSIFARHPNLIHAAGHEHSLQYNTTDQVHYIVSGAGSKHTHVEQKKLSQFAQDRVGFARLDFFRNGDTKLRFFSSDESGNEELLYEKLLFNDKYNPPLSGDEFAERYDLADSTISVQASTQYERNSSSYWIFGENYRDVWSAQVDVPLFDIGSVEGGLKILKKGGGMQTKSLRLEAEDERQYAIRTVEKYTEKAVPELLRPTIAADVVQDQISASHPYGAFVVPALAEAAEVYHTTPKYYYIPDDPRFGPYRQDFAGKLVLFEERPAGDWSNSSLFGSSDKIISTFKVIDKLEDDNDNSVDEEWVLKSRLFDLFIGDWDRHDDQWRWASFDKGKGVKGDLYRPIPRDRDQAFFINQGLLMRTARRKWALPKFQGFDYELNNPVGFMYNARYFDRDFMSSLEKEDWIRQAELLQTRLTDEVIEKAISKWPRPIYNLTGEEVIGKLKANRANLKRYALEYYSFLAREVDINGSDKKELFEVDRLDADRTRVRMYKMTNDKRKEKLLLERTFLTSETKEIRLYGMGGDDEFQVRGKVKSSSLVRIIGGKGDDVIVDSSRVLSLRNKTHIYDTKKGSDVIFGPTSRNRRSKSKSVNEYNRKAYKYDILAPLISVNYNVDDRVFLGGGFFYLQQGFRKDPFKSRHMFLGAWAPATSSWQFDYTAEYTKVVFNWDLVANVMAQAPNFTTNFFGLGNNTVFNKNAGNDFNLEKSIYYYRTRFRQYSAELFLRRRLGKNASLSFGPHWQGFEVQEDYNGEQRFILDFAAQSGDDNFFSFKTYGGLVLKFDYDTRNSPTKTTRGLYFETDLRGYEALNEQKASKDFSRLQGSLSYYQSFRLPSLFTMALRVGGGQNFGSYEFYQGQILGGRDFIRGYHRTRFIGTSKFYGNSEIRTRLFSILNSSLPMSVGVNGFFDIGRVWLENETSDLWHMGGGAGLWIAPLDLVTLNFEVAGSRETTLFYFRMGFLF